MDASKTTAADSASTTPAEEDKKEQEQQPEEDNANVEETFDTPVYPEIKFRCDWTLWEHYESQGHQQLDYAQSMCKACWFNDMVSFSVAWNSIPHRDLSNIFYNSDSRTVNM